MCLTADSDVFEVCSVFHKAVWQFSFQQYQILTNLYEVCIATITNDYPKYLPHVGSRTVRIRPAPFPGQK